MCLGSEHLQIFIPTAVTVWLLVPCPKEPSHLSSSHMSSGGSSIGGKCLIMTEWSSTGRNYARIKPELRGSGKTWHGRNWWDNMIILLLPLPLGAIIMHTGVTHSLLCWTSGPGLPYHPKVLLIQGVVQAGDTWKASAPA